MSLRQRLAEVRAGERATVVPPQGPRHKASLLRHAWLEVEVLPVPGRQGRELLAAG